ncbi:hypothetical protein T492DRAFT_847319 [Pavlovales sp. CCMP2436]|nr:hypothetical protein T492DRAFT_847319 [Pavlovales sp. CCMP2436]
MPTGTGWLAALLPPAGKTSRQPERTYDQPRALRRSDVAGDPTPLFLHEDFFSSNSFFSVPLSYFGSVHSTPAPTKGMKVLSSGRRGFEPYQSAAQICEDWDTDELRGLQVGASKDALDMLREQAARLVSKIRGLYARPRRQRVAGGGGERVTGAAPGANRVRRDARARAAHAPARRRAPAEHADASSLRVRRGLVEREGKVTTSIQRQVVREAGFSGRTGTREGLELLRSAVSRFPGDAELVNAAFYLRNNIHVCCPLSLGSALRADQLQLQLHLASSGGSQALSLGQLLARADLTVLCAAQARPPDHRGAPPCGGSRGHAGSSRARAAAALRTLAERCERTESFSAEMGLTAAGFDCLVDGMGNALNAALGAWPTNYYVLGRSGELLFDAAVAIDADGAFEGGGEARKLFAFVHGVLGGNKSARSVLPGA